MFKLLKSLSRSLSGSKPAEVKRPAAAKPGGSVLDKVAKGQPMTANMLKPAGSPKTPEEMCEVTPKMGKSEIHARLKLLFKRYNRAASSLDAKTRAEADAMLNAIVEVREKHFGMI